jgi:hypothetical protein
VNDRRVDGVAIRRDPGREGREGAVLGVGNPRVKIRRSPLPDHCVEAVDEIAGDDQVGHARFDSEDAGRMFRGNVIVADRQQSGDVTRRGPPSFPCRATVGEPSRLLMFLGIV